MVSVPVWQLAQAAQSFLLVVARAAKSFPHKDLKRYPCLQKLHD
jgi:hypothetical protein